MTASPPDLSGEAWLKSKPLQQLLRALNSDGGVARVAGGAVRNALLGDPISDVDIATTLLPEQVGARARSAGFGVHDTGLQHGTVTVVVRDEADHPHPFEVTTLRIDAETDGRRATVVFTDDWALDASRRDFTVNALYCDADGRIFDPLGGLKDVEARRIRFVGSPDERILEDHLRILRLFRFVSRYGIDTLDSDALDACIRHRKTMRVLSGERLRSELLKLLAGEAAAETVAIMIEHGILQVIIPGPFRTPALENMAAIDTQHGLAPDAIVRLAVLAEPADSWTAPLRFSNDEAGRLKALAAAPAISPIMPLGERRKALYQLGVSQYQDAVRHSWALSGAEHASQHWIDLLSLPSSWPVPKFPVRGRDLMRLGIPAGKELGEHLSRLEDWWIDNDFPADKDVILAQVASG